jgi:PST family polysaccharide transporter
VLGLVFNFWLARQASYTGAAWAWLLTEVSIAVMMWGYLYSKNIQVLDARYFNYAFISESIRPIWLSVRRKISKK